MQVWIRTKQSLLACSACLALTASITSLAHAQGDVEEAIGGLVNPYSTTIFIAKRVITMDDRNSSATAIAVSGDRIVAVGSLDSVKKALGSSPYSVDSTFDQRFIMPGLIDQHLHPILGALTLSIPVIAPDAWVLPGKTWPAATTHEEYMAALSAVEKGMQDPNEPLFTWGYHQFFHGVVRRKDLDSISLTRPIMIWHRSAHEVVLNTAALNKFGITKESVTGKGQPSDQSDWDNGYFYENGFFVLVAPKVLSTLASPGTNHIWHQANGGDAAQQWCNRLHGAGSGRNACLILFLPEGTWSPGRSDVLVLYRGRQDGLRKRRRFRWRHPGLRGGCQQHPDDR